MTKVDTEFFFDDMGVGVLYRTPTKPGRYGYMAFRGPGHYEMCRAIEANGTARCYSLTGNGSRVAFSVVGFSKDGDLILEDFVDELAR
ncbi:hypothetical protein [Lysobacter enzymogenes]|uniref:hypothetical protein n=1 Tax=Lysobacter enzymogenes TaxID=69 RepID=UPI0008982CCD|nr:hypothetical protein [Lysobacter enzymogenes]SDW96517.1 hypothetical protein SAMN05421681_103351 [Lysobacter enzymogenes]